MSSPPAPLTGVAASPGVAFGPALRWDGHDGDTAGIEAAASVQDASTRLVADLDQRAAECSTREGREVLEALSMLAADPGLLMAADQLIGEGSAPPAAVRVAAETYAEQLRGLSGPLAERAVDVVDVGNRLAAHLEGRAVASLPNPGYPHVLVAADLAPADTALLDPAVVVAIVTEQGGPTSHTTILARSLGIPAVVACPGARDAASGRDVLVDGSAGVLHVDVSPELASQLAEREAAAAERRARISGPGATADGTAVALLANVGTLEEAVAAAAGDVEGVGLFRTEFLFLGRAEEPSLDEQTDVYADVLAAFGDRRVVFRTLDAGSDKPAPFLGLPEEENPALGVRGLRTMTTRPDVLDRQLQALAAATERTGRQPDVMAPMVSTADEADDFAELARAAGLGRVGIMIEVPAAALRSKTLLAAVDFASLGTNDLAQYALAADRQEGRLAALLDPWQPAVLDLIASACAGGLATGTPVGVCGEAAADPSLAVVLVGLGARSLSMSPAAVSRVRAALAEVTLEVCVRAADAARDARTATAGRAAVAKVLTG